jgi:hypothetical protein
LAYHAENRLISATVGLATTQYVYDGDGTLVQKVAGGQTTVYVGPHCEKNLTTGVVTKYYTLGGQRVAMRVGSDVTWIHGDHLGSASLTTDINRITTGELRYYPYGEARGTSTVPTDRRFTGQREDYYTQLYQMDAWWSTRGSFASPPDNLQDELWHPRITAGGRVGTASLSDLITL